MRMAMGIKMRMRTGMRRRGRRDAVDSGDGGAESSHSSEHSLTPTLSGTEEPDKKGCALQLHTCTQSSVT